MNEDNLAKQEESVKKQEAMKRGLLKNGVCWLQYLKLERRDPDPLEHSSGGGP